MKVLFVASGNSEELLVYVSVCRALQKKGCKVGLSCYATPAAPWLMDLVTSYEIPYLPRHLPNPYSLFHSPKGTELLEAGMAKELYRTIKETQVSQLDKELEEILNYCDDIDGIVSSMDMHYLSECICEKKQISLINCFITPKAPTAQFAPILTGYSSGMGVVNKLLNVWSRWNRPKVELVAVNGIRTSLGLDLISDLSAIESIPTPTFHALSTLILPKPTDWPFQLEFCGYCAIPMSPEWKPSTQLVSFVERAPAPIFIDFENINHLLSPSRLNILLDVLDSLDVRAIVCTSGSALQSATLTQNNAVMYVDYVPLDWLLPYCSAVIHSGLISTCSAILATGIPMGICAEFGDQYFWGNLMNTLGVAPLPLTMHELTAEDFMDIMLVIISPETRTLAKTLASKLRQEDGSNSISEKIIARLQSKTHRSIPKVGN